MFQVQNVTKVTWGWVTRVTLTHTCPEGKFWNWPNWVKTYIIRSVWTRETQWWQDYCSILIRKKLRKTILLKKCVFLPTLITCLALIIDLSRNLMVWSWKSASRAFECFFSFFIAIIVTKPAVARKNRKAVLFCQNGQHFGNTTLFDLEGVDPWSQNVGQKKF